MKVIYLLVAAGIILVSVMGIAGMFAKPVKGAAANVSFTNTTAIAQDPAGSSLFGIVFLIIGSLLWRMFCELFVVLSRVHDTHAHEVEAEPEDEPAVYEEEDSAVPDEEGPKQYVECPKCGKIVPVEDLRECEHCGIQGCVNCIRLMGLLKKTMTCRECFEAK
jgi:hypothetical protein